MNIEQLLENCAPADNYDEALYKTADGCIGSSFGHISRHDLNEELVNACQTLGTKCEVEFRDINFNKTDIVSSIYCRELALKVKIGGCLYDILPSTIIPVARLMFHEVVYVADLHPGNIPKSITISACHTILNNSMRSDLRHGIVRCDQFACPSDSQG